MKKKGLIISTAVMVVVLIAALTTGTFAWFTTTAQASIDELEVMTQASKGLQIAVYKPETAQATAYTSGAATYDDAWTGQNTGFGASIGFTTSATYMGVSGDGQKMYSLNDPEAAFKADSLDDAVMKTAVANGVSGEYFEAYIALRNTNSTAQKVLLDTITVTAKADPNNAMSAGMAASLRIALFVDDTTGTGSTTPANTTFDEKESTLTYLPFNNFKFTEVGAEWSNGASTLNYLEEDTPAHAFETGTTKKSEMKETTLTVGDNVLSDDLTCSAAPETSTKQLKHQIAANVGANGVIYLKLVIWFEGQDPECISLFSGGGASINMVFVGEAAGA